MKLVDISCPHCGAGLTITDNAKTVRCEYCNHDFIIDDEVIRVAHRIEDAEQLGYDLEAGRQRYMREQEGEKNILQSGLCPHCGTAVFTDKKHTAEICYKCHKKFNTEAANLFERASLLAGYEPETNALQYYVEALQYYDEALALQSDGAMLIKHRNKCNFRKVLSVLDEAINTIKFLLFNPVIVIAIVVGTGISAGLGYNNIAVKLFLFSFVYPLLWKMAYASWGERIYLLVVAIILLLVIF